MEPVRYRKYHIILLILLILTYIGYPGSNCDKIYMFSSKHSKVNSNNIIIDDIFHRYAKYSHIRECKNDNSLFCYEANLDTVDPLSLPIPIPYWDNFTNPCFYDRNGNAKCFPYLFCLSPQKSGTGDLFSKLLNHKNIVRGKRKEPQFWDRGGHERYIPQYLNPQTISQYLELFDKSLKDIEAGKDQENIYYHPTITLDFSATTIYDMIRWNRLPVNKDKEEPLVGTPQFIKHVLPNSKFVALFRNPVERLYSDWCFFYDKKGVMPELFHEKVLKGIKWFNNCINSLKPYRACLFNSPELDVYNISQSTLPEHIWDPTVRLRIGLYSDLIAEWFQEFSPDNFYITTFEQYTKNTTTVANEIFNFLGLKSLALAEFRDINIKNQHFKIKPMLNDTRKILTEFYMPYNMKLAKRLKDNKYLWI